MAKKGKSGLLKKVMSKNTWPSWRLSLSGLKLKPLDFRMTMILDNVLFKILSVVEVIVLLSTLCFFYLCCGCHI